MRALHSPQIRALRARINRNQVGFGGVRRVPAALAGACAAAAISIPTEPALTLATARLPRWLCQNRDTPHLDNDLCGVDMTSAARALQAARASRIRDDLGNFETDVSRATCACSFVECTSLKWCNL